MTISVKIDRQAGTISASSDRTADVATVRIAGMGQDLKDRAMFDGFRIRLERAGAMGFDHWDGKDKAKRYATDHEKLARIKRVAEHLNGPGVGWDWDLRPQSDPLAGKGQAELEALIKAAQAKLLNLGINATITAVVTPEVPAEDKGDSSTEDKREDGA